MKEALNIDMVKCPKCEAVTTHHIGVEVFERVESDSPAGQHIMISGEEIAIDRKIDDNPSPGRNAVRIEVVCDSCENLFLFEILQYKGSTITRVYSVVKEAAE